MSDTPIFDLVAAERALAFEGEVQAAIDHLTRPPLSPVRLAWDALKLWWTR